MAAGTVVPSTPALALETGQGIIQGTVFWDSNQNGRRDSDEPAAAGMNVELWSSIATQPARLQTA